MNDRTASDVVRNDKRFVYLKSHVQSIEVKFVASLSRGLRGYGPRGREVLKFLDRCLESDPTGNIIYGVVVLLLCQLVYKSSLSCIYDGNFSFDGTGSGKIANLVEFLCERHKHPFNGFTS